MGDEEVDILVTDIRMPGMNGVELLQHVQADYPQIIRVVLSGHAQASDMLGVIPVAHRFLSKPCPSVALEAVLDELSELARMVADPALRRFVHSVRELPVVPGLVRKLQTAIDDPNTTLGSLGDIVEHDPSCSAKLLQVVNAPFFGMTQPIQNVGDAICRLGSNTVLAVALAIETFRMRPSALPKCFDLESFQNQAFRGAGLARVLADDPQTAASAFTAALLSDVGLLLLLKPAHASHHDAWGDHWPNVFEQERDAGLVTHPQIAAYLLGLWGLPSGVIDGVRYHHTPEEAPEPSELIDIVHIATAMSRGQKPNTAHLEQQGRAHLVRRAIDKMS